MAALVGTYSVSNTGVVDQAEMEGMKYSFNRVGDYVEVFFKGKSLGTHKVKSFQQISYILVNIDGRETQIDLTEVRK